MTEYMPLPGSPPSDNYVRTDAGGAIRVGGTEVPLDSVVAASGTHLSPQEALRAIMRANNLSQAQVGKIIGSESAVSMFPSGGRNLSKSHIKALVERFRIDASLFL
jgi:hypothetical protein